MFGFALDDLDDATVEIWPDNLAAHNAFVAMSSQWRHGFNGPTGLDYNTLPFVFRTIGLPRKEWPDVFEDVRVMEAETMNAFAEQREQKQ